MNENWDLKPIIIQNDNDENSNIQNKKGFSIIFPFLLVIIICFFGANRCNSYYETLIYCLMFLLESLISFIISKISSSFSFQQSSIKFSIFFLFCSIFLILIYFIKINFQFF